MEELGEELKQMTDIFDVLNPWRWTVWGKNVSKKSRELYNALTVDVPEMGDRGRDIKAILDTEYSLPVVYGDQRLGGNIVFYNVTGEDNRFLDIVVAVCEGEIKGFDKVYMNDEAIPIFDSGGSLFTHTAQQNTTSPIYGATTASGKCIFPTADNFTPYGVVAIRKGVNNQFILLRPNVDFAIGATLSDSITNLVNVLNASSHPVISQATYSKMLLGAGVPYTGGGIEINYDSPGATGNDFYIGCIAHVQGTTRLNECAVTLSGGSDDNYIEAYFYNGTDTQSANSQLISAYPPSGDSTGWTVNHTLSGIAYAYIRMAHNPDLFEGGIPKFSFEIKGKKVYDPRTAITDFSENPAVCLRDYLLNSRYGKALDPNSLDDTSIIDAANDCDTSRTAIPGVPSAALYGIGGVVDTNQPIKDNVAKILQTMNASLPYYDGKYYLKVMKAGNATLDFNEDNIIGSISVVSSTKRNRYNKVLISFPDRARNYEIGEAPIENSSYLSEDNNQVLEKRIDAPYVNYYPRASDLAELVLNLSRAGLTADFTTTMGALKAVPGDIVSITYAPFSWSGKEFRINSIVLRMDGLCDVSVTEHEDSYYTLVDKVAPEEPSPVDLPLPNEVIKPEIYKITCNKDTFLVNSDGTITPRIYIAWYDISEYPYRYKIYLKKESETAFNQVGFVGKNDNLEFYVPNVEWDTDYEVGVAVENGLGLTSPISKTRITVPNPLTGANYNYPDVKGLELIGEGTEQGQGNNTDFTGRDIKLQWRLSSNNVTYEFGSTAAEQLGALTGVIPFSLKGYRVEVYHPNDITPRQEYFVTDPFFTYTLDKNIEDGNGVPSRTVTFKVIAVGQVAGYGIAGESEIPAKITVSNPAPSLPTGVNLSTGFQTVTLKYDRPNLADWSGILVWLDTTTGFTPSSANLVYSGTDNNVVIPGLTSGVTYYVRYALIDTFVDPSQTDDTGLTLSAESSLTTDIAVTSSEIQNLIADKIAAGTLGEAVTLGGVFVASGTEAVLNGTGPTLGTYRLDLGPVAHTGSTYVVNFYNGYDDAHGSYDSKFSIDESGNAIFGGDLNAAGGTFSDLTVASGGYIRGGQTAYNTGTGFWLGDVSGTKKFSLGSATKSVTWDGTDLTVKGDITADSITLLTDYSSSQVVNASNTGTFNFSYYLPDYVLIVYANVPNANLTWTCITRKDHTGPPPGDGYSWNGYERNFNGGPGAVRPSAAPANETTQVTVTNNGTNNCIITVKLIPV